MTDERLALIVRSAFSGMMEAILHASRTESEEQEPLPRRALNPSRRTARKRSRSHDGPGVVPSAVDELVFPSVSAMESTGSSPASDLAGPEGNTDIEMALAALKRARDLDAGLAYSEVQPGPGEHEGSRWLGLPQ